MKSLIGTPAYTSLHYTARRVSSGAMSARLQPNRLNGAHVRSTNGWREFYPAIALLIVGVLSLGAAMLAPSGKGGQYAVVAPPWYSLGQTITLIQDAHGGIAEFGSPANVVIVQSDKPGFVRDLYRAGAWLVIDPMRLRGCVSFRAEVKGEQHDA